MDKILFHIAGIAILEILFYFYYIGPMESQVFKSTFKNSINDALKDNDPNSPLNFPEPIKEYLIQYNQQKGGVFEEDLKKEADDSEKDREKHNEQLFGLVFGYWILTILGILFIFIFRKVVTHYLNRDNQNIPPFNREISIHDIEENTTRDDIQLLPNDNDTNNKYKLIWEVIYYFFLAGFILLFEYIFFQYIVLEYHIVSSKEIEYIVFTQFFGTLNEEVAKYTKLLKA